MEFFIKQEMFFLEHFFLGFIKFMRNLCYHTASFFMDVRPRQILNKILLVQKRILRTIFFRRKFDQITEKFSEYNIDTVFELFLDTVFKEVIYQILGKSP